MKNVTLAIIILIVFLGYGCDSNTEFVSNTVEVDKPVDHYYEVKYAYYYCRSNNFEYEAVEMNIPDNSMNVSVKLYTQESDAACLRDDTYGLSNEYTIYCQDGCRGRFKVSYELEIIK